MTQKLKILGPYTPDHEGPFCTRDGRSVRLISKTEGAQKFPVVGIIEDHNSPDAWTDNGCYNPDYSEYSLDLMNAEEVSQPREFWINEYPNGDMEAYHSRNSADCNQRRNRHKIIHVREVLPGEGE